MADKGMADALDALLFGGDGAQEMYHERDDALEDVAEPAQKRQRAEPPPPSAAAAGEPDAADAAGCPPHPGVIHGLCIRCGALVEEADTAVGKSSSQGAAASTTTIKHLSRKTLQLSAEEASRRALDTLPALLASKRLVLILDLDHTLLNSVREFDVASEERQVLQQYIQQQAEAAAGRSCHQASAVAAAAAGGGDASHDSKVAANGVSASPSHAPDVSSKDTAAFAAVSSSGEAQGSPDASTSSAGPSSATATTQQQQQQQQQQPVSRCPWPLQPPLLYHLYDKSLWTKLRPGVFDFLAAASKLYELHIYTMGDKSYAGLIAKLLDPTGRLFGERVISQADSTRRHQKDLDVTLTSDRHVLILDDTEQVWEHHKRNLIQIERYHYFGSSLRGWYPLAQGHAECGTDEGAPPGPCCLSTCLNVLKQVHAEFFSLDSSDDSDSGSADEADAAGDAAAAAAAGGSAAAEQLQAGQQQQRMGIGRRVVRRGPVQLPPSNAAAGQEADVHSTVAAGGAAAGRAAPSSDPMVQALLTKDVRLCLLDVRAKILRGCCLTFSRCWAQSAPSHEQALWQMAQVMGAECSTQYSAATTTHLITLPEKGANPTLPLTSKVQAAMKDGKWVVHSDWLSACRVNWEHVEEAPYKLPEYMVSGRCTASRWRGFGTWAGAEGVKDVARKHKEDGVQAAVGDTAAAAAADAARALKAAGKAGT